MLRKIAFNVFGIAYSDKVNGDIDNYTRTCINEDHLDHFFVTNNDTNDLGTDAMYWWTTTITAFAIG